MNAIPWTLNGTHAHLAHARIKASIELAHANVGLTEFSINGATLANTSLLNIVAPSLTSKPPIDIYVRQQDLVATYEEPDGQRQRLQAYWRVVNSDSEPFTTTLELVVSVQTDLLDSHPAMFASSQFVAAEVSRFAVAENNEPVLIRRNAVDQAGFLLIRPHDAEASFMQAAHPTDFAGIELSQSDGTFQPVELRHPLFAESLEKGVIRRARIRLAILPRENDLALATACYRDFAASEPMLTV